MQKIVRRGHFPQKNRLTGLGLSQIRLPIHDLHMILIVNGVFL
jgi:hypothetical protein